jgi:hypothetical protein
MRYLAACFQAGAVLGAPALFETLLLVLGPKLGTGGGPLFAAAAGAGAPPPPSRCCRCFIFKACNVVGKSKVRGIGWKKEMSMITISSCIDMAALGFGDFFCKHNTFGAIKKNH